MPTSRTLVSGWVGSASNMWVSDADGSTWHFDGKRWAEAPAEVPIGRLLASPDGTMWGVTFSTGAHGAAGALELWRREDSQWVRAMDPFPYCISGDFLIAPDGSPWSAGLTCTGGSVSAMEVHRWNGTTWQRVGEPMLDQDWYPRLSRLGGTISVQAFGARFSWNGVAWVNAPSAGYPQRLDLSLIGVYDGLGYSIVPRALDCRDAFRLDDSHAWCFGEGRIFETRGAEWVRVLPDPFEQTQDAARWGSIPPSVWAGGETTTHAWGSGPSDVYRIRGEANLEHFDGMNWKAVLEGRAFDIDGASASDVWFATEAGVFHFDGNSLEKVPVPAEFASAKSTGVRALGGGAALAIIGGVLLGFDGSWRVIHRPPKDMFVSSVAGTGLTDLWLLQQTGGRGTRRELLHSDGSRFTSFEVTQLDWYASLATRNGQTWLAVDDAVIPLGVSGNGPSVPVPGLRATPSLWLGPDSIWLFSAKSARRHPLPQ